MKIGMKLVLSFASASAIGAVIGAVGFSALARTKHVIEEIGSNDLPAVQALLTLQESAAEIKAAQRSLLDVSISPAERESLYATIEHAEETAHDAWSVYERCAKSEKETELWTRLAPAWATLEKNGHDFAAIAHEMDGVIEAYNRSDRATRMTIT